MRQLGTEEKAALLLPADDDDDDNDNHELIHSPSNGSTDRFLAIANRPRSYHRRYTSSTHPVLCFTLILGAFILGCVSGVVIMLYRMSQDSDHGPSSSSTSNILQLTPNVDLSIRTKLSESISARNFMNLNHSTESENEAAMKLFQQWQSLSSSLSDVNKFSYDVMLSKYAPMTQWSGIQLLDGKSDKELVKIDRLSMEDVISFSSLIKSGVLEGNSIYYVNYGRPEDFAYLFKLKINLRNSEKSIVFMRRKQTVLTQTEQIHQAIYYGFGAVVLFDDNENRQTATTNDRQSFFGEWARYWEAKERDDFLKRISNNIDRSIPVLILSYDDVQRIFGSLQPDSNEWLSCPTQWNEKSTLLKIGGALSTIKLRLTVNTEQIETQLPVVMSSIRGTIDSDHFIMIGYQLRSTQQNRIVNEILQAYINQIKNGWNPKRSILFCAWSGLDYDQYTVRRWIADNYRLIDRNLIAYLDLGNDIHGNSTLNLHGSPLLEQVAYRAANFVSSPLEHNHTCHRRQTLTTTTIISTNEENQHHDHGRKRRDGDHKHNMETNKQEENECEPHKLLDEWMRASRNRIAPNQSLAIVQSIDADSSAALFQLQYGIPSIVIEMTDEQALTNDTFYVHHSPAIFDQEIEPQVFVGYTQFISELIRQLIDEPLIPFNLTHYAQHIDKLVIQYLAHFPKQYRSLFFHIGHPNEFAKTLNDLTTSIRQFQLRLDQTPKNDYIRLQSLNKQLIDFERLLIGNDELHGMNRADKIFKHIITGPAFALTNTAVAFPALSNILFDIPEDPPTEFCDASMVFWAKLKEHVYLINRTLNGFDGLLTKNK